MIYFFKDKILIFTSFFVFIILNLIENLIQFTIGRKHTSKVLEITKPQKKDWTKIIITMVIFAVLQALCTSFFNKLFHQY